MLALIGIKDWIYAGVIAVILASGVWFVHHERVIGAQKIEAADAKLAATQSAYVAQAQKLANAAQTKIGETYEDTIRAPVTNAPVARLCLAPGSRTVPATARTHPGPASAPVGGSADTSNVTAGPDIGLKLVTIGHDADALITALQAENAALRAEMEGK
jgi:hypothetical protein